MLGCFREYDITVRLHESFNKSRLFVLQSVGILHRIWRTSSEAINKILFHLKQSDLLVIGDSKSHIISVWLPIEPFNARDAWRYFIGSYVVEIWREARDLRHILQAGVLYLLVFARCRGVHHFHITCQFALLLHFLCTFWLVLKEDEMAGVVARRKNLALLVKPDLGNELDFRLLITGHVLELREVLWAETEALHSLPRVRVLPGLLDYVWVQLSRGALLLLLATACLGDTASKLWVRKAATFNHLFKRGPAFLKLLHYSNYNNNKLLRSVLKFNITNNWSN